MSLQATPVTAAGNGYYFALASDPGLSQTLSLSSNTISISGGNSVNIANATLVSTSAVKLTAQSFIAGFNTTNFTGDVRSEGSVISAPPLGLGTATLNGSLANVTVSGIGVNNPSVLFQKSVSSASIVYNGADIQMSSLSVSTLTVSDLIAGTDLKLKGTNPSVDFFNSANVQKASLDYVELTDKLTATATNVIMESTGTGAPRVLLDAAAGVAEVRADNLPVRLRRYSAGGTTLTNAIDLESSGIVRLTGNDVVAEPVSGTFGVQSTGVPAKVRFFDGLNEGSITYDNATGMELKVESAASGDFGITMRPANGIVEVKSDNTLGYPPTLTFNETSIPATATTAFNGTALTTTLPSGLNCVLDSSAFDITTTAARLKVNGGAVEGVQIGTDGIENYVAGYGLPMKIAWADSLLATDYIELNQATGGVCKIVQTENIELDTPLLTFTGVALESATAGGNSGKHLVITLNSVQYKIKLENP